MKLYVITDTWSDYKNSEFSTDTFYFVSEDLAIQKLEELHSDFCYGCKYVKTCGSKLCKGEKCKKCYYACESCGRIKDDFYEMNRSTGCVYESMVYADVINMNEIKEKGALKIKNTHKFSCDPTHNGEYVQIANKKAEKHNYEYP